MASLRARRVELPILLATLTVIASPGLGDSAGVLAAIAVVSAVSGLAAP